MRFIGFERKHLLLLLLLLLLLQIEDLIELHVLVAGLPPGVPHTGPVAALAGAPVLQVSPRPPPHLALTETPPVGGRSCRPGNITRFLLKFLKVFQTDQTAFIISKFPYLLGLASIFGGFC